LPTAFGRNDKRTVPPSVNCGLGPIVRSEASEVATCAFGLCSNHPFVDGNKRVALATLDVFLRIDGWGFRHRNTSFMEAHPLGFAGRRRGVAR